MWRMRQIIGWTVNSWLQHPPVRIFQCPFLSFSHGWFLLVFWDELGDASRNLTIRFLCVILFTKIISLCGSAKVFLIRLFIELWKYVPVSNTPINFFSLLSKSWFNVPDSSLSLYKSQDEVIRSFSWMNKTKWDVR